MLHKMRGLQDSRNRKKKFCGTAIAKKGNDRRDGYTKGERKRNLKIEKKIFVERVTLKKENDQHSRLH